MRKVLARIGLIVFGLLLSAAAVEVILQAGALYVRWQGTDIGSWTSRGALRVLALGDSNTYGLHLPDRNEAYPMMLEQLWRKRYPDHPIEVINTGVPGTNSSKLRNQFPALLRTFHPDVVTVMVGANDFWTEPEPIRTSEAEPSEEPFSLWSYSRLYRLLYMVVRAAQRPKVEVEFANPEGYRPNRGTVRYGERTFDLGWTRRTTEGAADWEEKLTENCEALVEQAREAGTVPILLTYASESAIYGTASALTRKVALATHAPLVDLEPVFHPLCPQGDCRDLYYPSQHPTAKGHRLIAAALLRRMADLTLDTRST